MEDPAPQEGVVVRVCSWNVAESSAEMEEELFGRWLVGDRVPDVVAVGLQEVDMTGRALCVGCCGVGTGKGEAWKDSIGAFLHGKGYKLVADSQLMGLMTLVWVLDGVYCEVETKQVNTGFFNICGNKGGVSIRVVVGEWSACFVNCHLAAKKKNIERRNRDAKKIFSNTKFKAHPKGVEDHTYVLCFGDLNYRFEDWTTDVEDPSTDKMSLIAKYDQLHHLMTKNEVFPHFKEPPITWPPSYKFIPGSPGTYDPRREPSYCDRILYYHHSFSQPPATTNSPLLHYTELETFPDEDGAPPSPIHCLEYQSIAHGIERSDHRPVAGLFLLRGKGFGVEVVRSGEGDGLLVNQ